MGLKLTRTVLLIIFGGSLLMSACSGNDEGEPDSCSDGLQNQGEQGVDCGGPCGPCGACSDGVQNQDEEGVDCGGSCPDACPTCDDGVRNQDEQGVDCGGSCPSCPAVSVSGTLSAASGSVMDSDTNDPMAEAIDNDAFDRAQVIPNPAAVGGFVTAVPTGRPGDRFANEADAFDVFRVSLAAGQAISLTIADFEGTQDVDLDLFLFAEGDLTVPVDFSEGLGGTEVVNVPSNGAYYIVVRGFAGTSNYVLAIGQQREGESAPRPAFVPGEVVVRFTSFAAGPQGNSDIATKAASLGLVAKGGGPRRAARLALPHDSQRRSLALRTLGVGASKAPWELNLPRDSEARLLLETRRMLKALRRRADVATADLNYIRRAYAVPNDEFYPLQWHYPLINLPQAWDIESGTSSPVTVAVIDTGVALDHQDLQGVLIDGYDFISDPDNARDGDGIDPNPDDAGDLALGNRSSFHGTHVAGTVAAATQNQRAVAGVSWGAKVMPLRVLGASGGADYDIIQSVLFAAGLPNDSGRVPSQRADIINMSLGGAGFSQAFQDACTQARNAGVIIIAAAGNASSSELRYPASYDGVVSVSAVDRHKQLAPYSSFGTAVDIAAPGGDTSVDDDGDGFSDGVLSTMMNDADGAKEQVYEFSDGTSMAAPHVAGVVALMKARAPAAVTPAALDAWIQAGSITEDLMGDGPSVRNDTFGYGLIDALAAVRAVSGTALPTALTASPNVLSFDNTATEAVLTLERSGDGAAAVVGVTDNADWLTVAAPPTTDGLGVYTVTVDRTGLPPGRYAASIDFDYTVDGEARRISVAVSMETVGTVSFVPDTGFTWVILLDAETGATLATQTAENSNGSYQYTFSNVPAGAYRIVGGSDSDNDGFLCDAGESCGGYPTVSRPEVITVGGRDISNLGFDLVFPRTVFPEATSSAPRPRVAGFQKSVTRKEALGSSPHDLGRGP